MSKVGRITVDPKAGAYCQITLDNGQKLVVAHDKAGSKGGRLTVEVTKLFGFSSDLIFACDLETAEGQGAVTALMHEGTSSAEDPTPLPALIAYLEDCASAEQVKTKCEALLRTPGSGPGPVV